MRHPRKWQLAALVCALVWAFLWYASASPAHASASSPARQSAIVYPTAAPAPTYYFLHRDYLVRIMRNGDVRITEHWDVHLSVAESEYDHGMCGCIQQYGQALIGFEFVSGLDFSWGCMLGVTNCDRPHGVYPQGVAVLPWRFLPAHQIAFDITYIVHGALQLGTTEAWFDWHFLDYKSAETAAIQSSAVRIVLPALTSPSEVYYAAADPDQMPFARYVDGDAVEASAARLTAAHPFEVEVAFPRSELDSDVVRPTWQTATMPPLLPTKSWIAIENSFLIAPSLPGIAYPMDPPFPQRPTLSAVISALAFLLFLLAMILVPVTLIVWVDRKFLQDPRLAQSWDEEYRDGSPHRGLL